LNDFAPIALLAMSPQFLFIRKAMPAKDLNELIAWLKANPNTASAGIGATTAHLITAFFKKKLAAICPRALPRRSPRDPGPPRRSDRHMSRITGSIATGTDRKHESHAATTDTRSALAPDIPTFAEMGWPSLSFSNWYALFAPRGTPKEIIDRLNAVTLEALADLTVRSRLAVLGFEIFPREQQTPEALSALQKADAEKWWPIIKELGIKAE
jgi:tripartite-type tricarboxylate transporter receptor subunit TctC